MLKIVFPINHKVRRMDGSNNTGLSPRRMGFVSRVSLKRILNKPKFNETFRVNNKRQRHMRKLPYFMRWDGENVLAERDVSPFVL